jgi:hypothetical protein
MAQYLQTFYKLSFGKIYYVSYTNLIIYQLHAL